MRPPSSNTWSVDVDGNEVSAVFDHAAAGGDGTVFVCAHGAGGNLADRGVLAVAGALRQRGIHVVRFNFVYRERGANRPDPMPRLEQCVAAVVARSRDELQPSTLIIGGRSMGGRAASMLAAHGFASDGLLLFAYPLHPPGQPEKLRDAHLPAITVPVLCFNGTRDEFCRRDLMADVLSRVTTRWDMHWIEGADHGFHVLRSSGRRDTDVLDEMGDVTGRWIAELSARST
jgi:hypothetical protein